MTDTPPPPADDRHPDLPAPEGKIVEVHGSAFQQVSTEQGGVEISAAEAEAELPMDAPPAETPPSSRDLAAEQHPEDD